MRRLSARMSYSVRKANLLTVHFSVLSPDRRRRGETYTVASERPQHLMLEHQDNRCLAGSVGKGADHGMFSKWMGSVLHRIAEAARCRPGQCYAPRLLSMLIRAPCLMSLRVRPSPCPFLIPHRWKASTSGTGRRCDLSTAISVP